MSRYLIGVDSGGTFTDCVIVTKQGEIAIGKALSTQDRPADGVLASIAAAGSEFDIPLDEVLAGAELIAHGTTVGVNALLTHSGARVGLLTTSGFEDTVAIARTHKTVGLEEALQTEATHWEKPPSLIPPRAIKGIRERVDVAGKVVVPLDEHGARIAVRALGEQEVEAIGVSLLWSFLNPMHERRLSEIVREELGDDIELTLSCELAPRAGEYERTITVLLNSYVAPIVASYLRDLEQQLRDHRFTGSLIVMRSEGGVQPAEQMVGRAVETLRSGPVGGLAAASWIGDLIGHKSIVSTDVGGTSFEVGLLVDGEMQRARTPVIGRYATATPVIDIESIGTGGGSIAWIDEIAGTLKVGPESAGASPGPACYGRGGTAATVTDAAVALGYVVELGGDLELDAAAAREAVEHTIAAPLGLGVEQAAEGILSVANAQMADLVRRMTVQRGHDPRSFALYAFGGAAPQYAGRYARDLGVSEVVIPALASVFSAFGAVSSDLKTSAQLDAPRKFPPDAAWLSARLDELKARVVGQFALDSASELSSAQPRIRRAVALRFRQQVHEIWMALPDGRLDGGSLARVGAEFEDEYERQFGAGTAYTVAGVEMVGMRVEAEVPVDCPAPKRMTTDQRTPHAHREAWFDDARVSCPIYDGERVAPDLEIEGPAFLEVPTTTTVVYPGQTARVDSYGNTFLRVMSEAKPAPQGAGPALLEV